MWRWELQTDGRHEAPLNTVARAMKAHGCEGVAFLDTAMPMAGEGQIATGRWSFLAAQPFGVFRVADGQAWWNGAPMHAPPLEALRGLLALYQMERDPEDLTPFRGGCIGWIAYDFARNLERLHIPAAPSGVDEAVFGFYDLVAALDHATGKIAVFSCGFSDDGAVDHVRARTRGEAMRDMVVAALREEAPVAEDKGAGVDAAGFVVSHDRAAWVTAVARVQEYIRAGDIFQANIARRFSLKLPASFDGFGFYQALRAENPAPFAAFLELAGHCIASSSPERFIALRDEVVEARPIKGTALRSDDPVEDAGAAAALLASDKDRAENVMIVDLLRNDLSRVCTPESVKVTSLCALESYANVHHLVSVVRGRLASGLDAIDLIAATFPGGSITGAPKIRAMDIIAEIEGAARGVYCGVIGYVGFDGHMDMNIAIRTVAMHADATGARQAVFQAGGGVTLMSDPEAEFDETDAKAARLFSAFARCHGGG